MRYLSILNSPGVVVRARGRRTGSPDIVLEFPATQRMRIGMAAFFADPGRCNLEGALVPAVARAVTLLEWVVGQREPTSLARLSAELALPKSTAHALCKTFVEYGYLCPASI